MKKSTLLLLSLILSFVSYSQTVTYDTTFLGWPAIVTRHVNHWQSDSVQGIIFFPGAGEIGNNVNLLRLHGPHYVMNQTGWNGSVELGNGTHYPVIISLQPPNQSTSPSIVRQRIDAILATFKIRRNGIRGTGKPDLHFTGISAGGLYATWFIMYKANAADVSYANMVNSEWIVQGVEAKFANVGSQAITWPQRYGWWSKNFRGRLTYFRNVPDSERSSSELIKSMNDSMPGSAAKVSTSIGTCGHCNFDEFYRMDRTWTVGQPDVDSVAWYDWTGSQTTPATSLNMNWAQWLLRNGDTTLVGGNSLPVVSIASVSPITLPANSVNLNGSATDADGTISGYLWEKVSGPAGAVFGSTSNPVITYSNLVAGTYVLKLTATDNNGGTSSAQITVTVNPAPGSLIETLINGTNAVVHLPDDYDSTKRYPLIYFRHGNGETGSTPADVSKMYVWGPFAKNSGVFRWNQDWTFTVNGQTVKPIVIAHQVPFSYNYGSVENSKPNFHNASLNAIVARWSIDTNKICLTGYSAGGWGVMGYVSYSQTFANRVHAIAVVASQRPGSGGSTTAYTHRCSNIINAGTRWFGTFGTADTTFLYYSYGVAVYDTLNAAGATAVFRSIPGAGHSGNYVHDFYNPEFVNPALGMDIYTWMLSDNASNLNPVANAGNDTTITLPADSVIVNASGSGDSDGTIASYVWTKVSGPAGGTIVNPNSVSTTISGLPAGTYVYRVTVTDDDGATGFDEVTITVNPAIAGNKTINVTIDGVSNYFKDPAWNSWYVTGNVITGITSGTFKYSDGTMSGISVFMNRQVATGDNTTSYTGFTGLPDSALRYVSNHSAARVLAIQGADDNKTYDISLYSSRNAAGFSTVFGYNGTQIPIATSGNKSAVATFTNITPVNGEFTIDITNGTGSTYNHLNAFVITEISGSGGSQLRVAGTGTNGVQSNKKAVTVRLSPNPVQEMLQANVQASDVSLTIIDGMGRVVRKVTLQAGVHSINMHGLPAGSYQVMVYQKGKWIETKSIVKL